MADVRDTRSEVPTRSGAARAAAAAAWGVVWIGAWCAVAGAAFLTLTRSVEMTRSITVLLAHGLTPYLYFAVWPGAALAVWRRKWVLAGASLAFVAIHIAVTLPAIWPHGTPDWAAAAPRLRVMVANVKEDNGVREAGARTLLAEDPDVFVLVEMNPQWDRSLADLGIRERYPHELLELTAGGGRGAAFYSKYPIAKGPEIDLDRGRIEPSAVVSLPDGTTVTVFAIHLVSPQSHTRQERWIDNMRRVVAAVPTIRGPFVLAGDFNATRWHPVFGELLDTGLADAHEHLGKGLSRSWPTDRRHHAPPVLRLDHALMSRDVTSLAVRDVDIPGSDHRAFLVDLAVRPGR